MTHPTYPTRLFRALSCSIAVTLSAVPALRAADTIAVPRSEFEQMKRDMAAMRQELNQLKTDRAMAPRVTTNAPRSSTAEAIALLNHRVDDLTNAAELSRPGETKMHLAGDATARFRINNYGSSSFSADFNPVFLWHLNKDLLFEAKVRFTLDEDETDTELRYAHLDWSLGDYITLVGGKFHNPINVFAERYEPGWINKLPDAPFTGGNIMLPETNVGFQLRGVLPIADVAKVTLAAFVANPPTLRFEEYGADVEFDNFQSFEDHKAFGGRVGLQIGPNFEVGYGVQQSRFEVEGGNVFIYDDLFGSPASSYRDSDSISGLVQTVDLQASLDALKGHWTLLGQYSWSDIDPFTVTRIYQDRVIDDGFFDPFTGFFLPPLVVPGFTSTTKFDDKLEAGYVQLSYRGRTFQTDFLNRFEVIARGDRMDLPFGAEEKRLTFGLDYWLTNSTVLKAAYERGYVDLEFSEFSYDSFVFAISTGL